MNAQLKSAQLTWVSVPDGFSAEPYRCYRGSNGEYSVWIYGKHGPKIIQRGVATAIKAKQICELHQRRRVGKW